ncbi:hypothetical protein ACFSWE_06145 [Leucobacter albus]|uniref:Uncharacterized protein n=1 Tax=Leucobacter albus TaxID=272210 RepID=A0ABW3TKQ7_9MICO
MPAHSGEAARLARLLFADVAEEVDRALADSQRAAGGRAATSRAEQIVEAAALAAREGDLARAAFAGIDGLEASRFARAFELAAEVAAWSGLALPAPEEFWGAGADHGALARALMADASLVAVPAVYGLGAAGWTALYRTAARQAASPLSLAAPLTLAPEVAAEFDLLDVPPRGVPAVGSGDLSWALRLVPGSPKPPLVGLSHAHGPHPTLPEMLMLQLMHLVAGKPLLDSGSLTWLDGTLGGGKFAARELYDTTDRSVRVNTREIGNQGPHLGARPPIG